MSTDDTSAKKPPLVQFTNATVQLGDTRALNSISFSIDVGENVAIIGPNGSGKSTLIKTITRECYPLFSEDGPAVRILGEHTWNIFSLRSMLGIVSADLQESCHRDHISGYEMVLSGFFGSIGVFPYHNVTDEMHKRTQEVLEFLEIEHLAEKATVAMSTGQARRVLIGRALVHDPDALILDEPTNGLDPRAIRKFTDAIRRVAQMGKSIVMVTHHLWDIVPEISRVIMVKDGKVYLDGPKAEVLTNKNLSELFDTEIELYINEDFYQMVV